MNRFQVVIRCTACRHKYRRTMTAADESALADMPDPPCPKCSAPAPVARGMDVSAGKAPAVGGSLAVRAVDTTAEIVMQDYGMTDLRSDVREGESAAPKLPPKLQEAADNMFGGGARRGRMGGVMGMSTQAVIKSAVAGRFMTPDTVNPIAMSHGKRERPPVNIIASDAPGR